MFLYARLVMENLYAQPTSADLKEGIRQDTFPQGLEGAYVPHHAQGMYCFIQPTSLLKPSRYERILRRMKHISSDEEWTRAKKLLGWMICAKRRLTWREMQVALSMDVDEQTIEYDDRRLRKHIHETCGSLVLLEDDRVSLVHSTARL